MDRRADIAVPSPCRDICSLDPRGVCIGCGRTAAEIQEWPRADGERKLHIRAAARARVEQELEAAQRREFRDRNPV